MIINTEQIAYDIIKKRTYLSLQEEVWLLSLNSDLRLIEIDMIFRGTADCCIFHPRDIVRTLCLRNATSFIVAHNHPSGCHLPSIEDIQATQKLLEISKLIEIKFRDHLIITQNNFFSFASSNLI